MSDSRQKEAERRKHPRQKTGLLHLSVTLREGDAEVAGEIIDLSTRGARIQFDGPTPSFAQGNQVVFRLSTSLDPEPLYLPALVRWNSAEQQSASPRLVVGVAFTGPDEDTSRELGAFVEIAHNAEDDLEQSIVVAPEEPLAQPDMVPAAPPATQPIPVAARATVGAAGISAREAAQAASAKANLSHLFAPRTLLITGKGGVGRTTIAVALARAAAARGKRVLVADIGDPRAGQCPLAHALGCDELSMDPVEVAPKIHACHLWGRRGHELFFSAVLPLRSLVRVAIGSRFLRAFLEAAPSFNEMGVFYHLLTLLRAQDADGAPRFELIVIDMPATGHALALTGLPRVLLRLIPGGPIVRLLNEGRAYLNNPQQAAAWIVTLPEMLPVSEAVELLDGLQESDMPVGGMILNRLPENPFTPAEQQVVEVLLDGAPKYGGLTYRRIAAAKAAYERLVTATRLPILVLPEHTEQVQTLVQRLARDIERAL